MEKFFDDLFRLMRQADPSMHNTFLQLIEQEFKREGYREEISLGVENILIARFDVVGDMILTSGFIREVRKNFPRARITLVCSPLVRPIVELCPYVNEVLTFDIKTLGGGGPYHRNFLLMLEKLTDFCREKLWQKKFDVAFSTQCDGDSFPLILMTWLSGARERIGYDFLPYRNYYMKPNAESDALGKFLLNRMVVPPAEMCVQAEAHLYLLSGSGFKVNQTHMELWFNEADAQRAKEFLEELPSSCKKVVLGVGAGAPNRKYPPEKLLVALKELLKKNFVFVAVGGKSELEAANFLEKNLPPEKFLNLVGQTTLRETEAVIAQSDFYLGNDTGVMHMAAAAHLPSVIIHRDAVGIEHFFQKFYINFYKFPPWQTKAIILRPSNYREYSTNYIAQISPQEIVAAFKELGVRS